MKHFYITILSFLIIPLYSLKAQVQELELISLFDNKLEIKVPVDFEIMTDDLLKLKYPLNRRPTLVYTNNSTTVNVAFNLTASPANQELLKTYKNTFISTFSSFYPDAEWLDNGIKTINNQDVVYLEVITQAVDNDIYNLIFFTYLNEKLLLCTFNCSKEKITNWKDTAHIIMNSLAIKP